MQCKKKHFLFSGKSSERDLTTMKVTLDSGSSSWVEVLVAVTIFCSWAGQFILIVTISIQGWNGCQKNLGQPCKRLRNN